MDIYLFPKLLLYKHICKVSPEQMPSVLMKGTEMWQTHRELSSTDMLLRLEETGMNNGLRPLMQNCWCTVSSQHWCRLGFSPFLPFPLCLPPSNRSAIRKSNGLYLQNTSKNTCLHLLPDHGNVISPLCSYNMEQPPIHLFLLCSFLPLYSLSPWSSQSGHSDYLQS